MAIVNGFKKCQLALACSFALLATSVAAGNDISGKITNESNSIYFEGALIQIEELGITQVSERDGSFRFKNLPEGDYTIVISYLGANVAEYSVSIVADKKVSKNFVINASQQDLEEVIVFGQQASQANALNRQKNALNFKNVVSADAVGQFPDQNIAESLQRLPGMFIQRDQGEGRFVGIRGIDPNLNNLTINGANIPSPESGVRSVAMDVIPSELIGSLEVSKTVTPDMDADAIGGSIEVKSLSAFDRQQQSYSFTVQTSHNEISSKNSPKFSASYSDVVDLDSGSKLGVAAAISWFERDFGSHNIETDGGWKNIELEDSVSGDDIEGVGAEEIEQRFYQITRERLGLALNFDLQTSEPSRYYFRALHSQFSDDEYRLRNEYKFDEGSVDASTWTNSRAEIFQAEMDRDTKDRYEEQEITSIVIGGEYSGDIWDIEYSLGYSKSSEEEPDRLDVDFSGEGFDIGYTSSGPIPTLNQSAAAHDLNNFELDSIEANDNLTEDKETSIKIDFSKGIVWNDNNGVVKFGTKLRDRSKFNDANIIIYDDGFDDLTAAPFIAASPSWSLGNFGPAISRDELRNYFRANRSQLEINQLESDLESQSQSYQSDEDILAGYIMLDLNIDRWKFVTGLRYESTDFKTAGNQVELIVDEVSDNESVVITPWNVRKDYEHWLPSLNIRYNFSDKLLARFAYTNTIARPAFSDSAAFQLIETETTIDGTEVETERKAEVGNPDLEAYESSNIDFSLEYYPGDIGLLSVGGFYKSIDNFILMAEVQDNGLWGGFEEVIQPINGGSTDLKGVELAWVKNYNSGLLLSANATLSDADEALPNQSDTVANFVVGFESKSISSRLSYSYKSKAFQFYDDNIAVFEDAHGQIDLNVKYYFDNKSFIYFNGINLSDEPFYLYHGSSQFNYQYEEYGRSFELGFTWNSF